MNPIEPFFIHWADSIEQHENKAELNITIDPNKMVGLKHHVFNGVCLVPFAYSTELMIQTVVHCSGVSSPYPIFLKQVEQLRGIPIPFGTTKPVKVSCEKLDDSSWSVRLVMDLTNKSGKVIRKDCAVATAIIETNKKANQEGPSVNTQDLNALDMPQALYYRCIHPTHGPLFQTLTGQLRIDTALERIGGTFNLKQLDNWQSIKPSLPFWVSPLAFDSVLQLSVLKCIQIESTTKPEFNAKLPIRLENAYFFEPFNPETDYLASGVITSLDDKDQQSRFVVEDDQGRNVASLETVTLRRASNKHMASNLLEDFAQFRQEEVAL